MIDLLCQKYNTTWSQIFPNHSLYSILFWCWFKCDAIEAVLVIKNNLSIWFFWELNSTFKKLCKKNTYYCFDHQYLLCTLWGEGEFGQESVWNPFPLSDWHGHPMKTILLCKGLKGNCYFSQTPTHGHRFT